LIIAEIKFPENYKENRYKQDTYLENIKSQVLYFINLHSLANNRNIQDSRYRIKFLENYIKETYDLNINVYSIINFIVNNLTYDIDRKYIILKNEIKLKGVKIITLIKIIKFGVLGVSGSDIIERSLKTAFDSIYVNNFLVNFRF